MAKIYTASKTIEHTGALPTTINADGNALLDYRIYGADGGVGDDSGTAYGYKLDIKTHKNSFTAQNMTSGKYLNVDARLNDSTYWSVSDYLPVIGGTTYYISAISTVGAASVYHQFYDANKNPILGVRAVVTAFTVTAPPNAKYFRLNVRTASVDADNVKMSSGSTTPIYIGDTPLGEDEYVDYGAQKIYRMSGGVLTPTDPPVPLPTLPTCDGTTIVDYDGTPKPSQMYVKYNSRSGWEPCAAKRYHISKNKFDESMADVISTLGGSRYGVDMGVMDGDHYLSFDIEPDVILCVDVGNTRLMYRGGGSETTHMSVPISITRASDVKIYTDASVDTTFADEGITDIMFNEGAAPQPYEPPGAWWEDCPEYVRHNGVWVPVTVT